MDDKTKTDLIKVFNEGVEVVIMPQFESIHEEFKGLHEDMEEVKNRLGVVETRLDVVERKLDRVVDNQLEDKGKLTDYGKRIKKLEASRAAV